MGAHRKDSKAEEMYELYGQGFSLDQVGKAFGVTRQSVYKMFKKRRYILRSKPKPLPFVEFNGYRYTLRNTGYYGRTNGERTLLHRDVWQSRYGSIPDGYDIHHLDRDRFNNHISNLELISKSEHASRYNTGKNGHN